MALTIDAAKWRRRRGVGRVLDALGGDDGLTRYVGGAVRDELLGLPVKDHDYVVVGASPEDMLKQGYKPVGRDFP
ncbi:MAG: hypothetical protein ACREBP_06260, partial [Sphingomicrobium sp.]